MGKQTERPRHRRSRSAAEAVQSAALTLERVHHVHSCDRLALGVLGVGDGIADHVLKEDLEDTASLLVDETRDALDAAAPSQPPDSGLGNALDVIAEDLAMALGATFPQTFAAFSTSRHLHRDTSSKPREACGDLSSKSLYFLGADLFENSQSGRSSRLHPLALCAPQSTET